MDERTNTPDHQSGSDHNPMRQPSKKLARLVLLALLVVVGLLLVLVHPSPKTSDTVNTPKFAKIEPAQVTVTDAGFMPETVTVKKGQSIVWTNKSGAAHQIATDPFPQEDGLLGFAQTTPTLPNDTYSYMFVRTGTFTYHDHLHPDSFHGTVIVK